MKSLVNWARGKLLEMPQFSSVGNRDDGDGSGFRRQREADQVVDLAAGVRQ